MKKIIKGLAFHVHHNILFEHCYDFEERVKAIKETKPENEQEIRLRVFKMLPKEAIAEIPKNVLKAYADCNKAYADRNKANADCNKAYADWSSKEAWHAKWCDCKEWNGKKLVFNK